MSASESPEYRRLHDQLEQAQADATRQLEQAQRRHSHRRPPGRQFDLGKWVMKWLIIPVGAAMALLLGAVELGSALAAAQGHGTAGYFVAEDETCYKDGCGWTGDFVSQNGRVMLRNIGFSGPHGTLYKGDRLPALDVGDAGYVYARHGSDAWIGDLAALVIGAAVFGLWAWRVPYRIVARRIHRNKFFMPPVT